MKCPNYDFVILEKSFYEMWHVTALATLVWVYMFPRIHCGNYKCRIYLGIMQLYSFLQRLYFFLYRDSLRNMKKIYMLSLSACLFVCTDRALYFCGNLHDPRESLWTVKIKMSTFILFWKCTKREKSGKIFFWRMEKTLNSNQLKVRKGAIKC